jgi:O-antigen/teichoic acid export membrane protein
VVAAADAAHRGGRDWHGSVGYLSLVTVFVGLANYGMMLALVRLLPSAQFNDFAAGQSLLLVLGTGSNAALPWAVARYLAGPREPRAAGKAMHFGLVGSAVQALVLAPVALIVSWSLAGPWFALTACVSTIMISLLAGPTGYLQGENRLGSIAAARSLETAVRVSISVVLVAILSRNAALAMVGFPIGSAVALAFALRRGRAGFPLHHMNRVAAMRLVSSAGCLGAVQVLLAGLAGLDTVYADGAAFGTVAIGSYQTAALLGRVPLFLSSAISTAGYTTLVAAPDDTVAGRHLRAALRTYAWLALPFLIGAVTLPEQVLSVVVPAKYTATHELLRYTCVAGLLVGAINVVTTSHQARGRFRSSIAILCCAVAVQSVVLFLTGRTAGVVGFAVGSLTVSAVTLAALLVDARQWLRGVRMSLDRTLLPIVALAAVAALVPSTSVWLGVLAIIAVLSVGRALAGRAPSPLVSTPSSRSTP